MSIIFFFKKTPLCCKMCGEFKMKVTIKIMGRGIDGPGVVGGGGLLQGLHVFPAAQIVLICKQFSGKIGRIICCSPPLPLGLPPPSPSVWEILDPLLRVEANCTMFSSRNTPHRFLQ